MADPLGGQRGFTQAETSRRLGNIVRLGRVVALDAPAARVKVETLGNVTTWLPWLTHRAGPDVTWWAPEPGEQVVVLAPGGELDQAVALPALYQTRHPAPADRPTVHRTVYDDGTTVEYDRVARVLRVAAPNQVSIHAEGQITLRGNVCITGHLQVMGTIRAEHEIYSRLRVWPPAPCVVPPMGPSDREALIDAADAQGGGHGG
ncbi:phage baseplate assembly protein V [Roseospira goensis]|uniref:Phage baseplate assembly protein V n=1 Tax=Roseospira goensis TaxID=391922 RepID=A0A7W6WMQ5_9PROT|nr:phage baseplate assembly protein V [Roseospira goensis]MBB4287747.1 phage baseplate assembly protein V [Roseospira goensis]